MLKALQIGNDLLLMQTRTGVLAGAGLKVMNLAGLAEALVHIPSGRWDVAILCHTLSRADRGAIIALLRRRNPRAPVLLVGRRSYTPAVEADQVDLVLSANPAKMIATLRELLQQPPQEE